MRVISGIGLACWLLAAGCSSDDEAGTSDTSTLPSMTSVLAQGWRNGPNGLGYDEGKESLPEGPRSFVVDKAGAVHILDTLNRRIAIFAHNKLQRTVNLPAGDFADLDITDKGGHVLLDPYQLHQAVTINAAGAVVGRAPLAGQGLDDPSAITAISHETSGVWVELHHATWLLVATPSGAPVKNRAKRLGKTVGSQGQMLQIARKPPYGFSLRHLTYKGTVKRVSVNNDAQVHGITGVEQDAAGNVYVGLFIEKAATKTTPAHMNHVLQKLDSKGNVRFTVPAPMLGPTQNTMRTVRQGHDGNIYTFTINSSGAYVSRLAP
jgi:hypothetical protein